MVADLAEAFEKVLDDHYDNVSDYAPFSLHLGSHGAFLCEFLEEGPSFGLPQGGALT